MPSKKETLDFVLDRLSGLEDISYRPMMGEYILYYRKKVFGGIYDDRFLIKPTKSAAELLPDAEYVLPYDGAKPMLLIGDPDNREFLLKLVRSMDADLPEPKKQTSRKTEKK